MLADELEGLPALADDDPADDSDPPAGQSAGQSLVAAVSIPARKPTALSRRR
jgi:hypothetical protein